MFLAMCDIAICNNICKGQGPRMGENGPMSECHKIISGNSTHHGIS